MSDGAQLGPSPARAAHDAPSLSAQRAGVLEAVQRHDEPVTTATLAAATGLHENTLREHLDALTARGLVVRGQAPAAGRGRPPITYAAAPRSEPDPRVREYTGLVMALAGQLARTSENPAEEARAAGRAWSRELADPSIPPAPSEREARREVVATFAELGFAPEADASACEIALRRCPLLDAAVRYPQVVCAAHRGLAEGLLEQRGAGECTVELQAFAEPGACRLRVHPAGTRDDRG